jgi:hypothetical protein
MLGTVLTFLGGAVVGFGIALLLPNKKYNKAKAELNELRNKVADAIDGDDKT